MSDETFTQGDTAPPVTGTLTKDDGTAFDLSVIDAVRFQMRKPDDQRYTIDELADIVGSPTAGKVSYSWSPNDLSVPGEYIAHWELLFLDGKLQTTKPDNTVTVARQ
jgi:hypothetical protein